MTGCSKINYTLLLNLYGAAAALGGKAAGRIADHSVPSVAKVKNEWSNDSTPIMLL